MERLRPREETGLVQYHRSFSTELEMEPRYPGSIPLPLPAAGKIQCLLNDHIGMIQPCQPQKTQSSFSQGPCPLPGQYFLSHFSRQVPKDSVSLSQRERLLSREVLRELGGLSSCCSPNPHSLPEGQAQQGQNRLLCVPNPSHQFKKHLPPRRTVQMLSWA